MKGAFSGCVAVLSTALLCGAVSAADHIRNGGFETGATGVGVPPHWHDESLRLKPSYVIVTAEDLPHPSRVLKVMASGSDAGELQLVNSSVPFEAGAMYEFGLTMMGAGGR